jgi:type III pantothenate kinase
MKKSLLQNTAALNFTPQSYEPGLANRTEAAIFSGTLYAATGLIEQALKMQSRSAVLLLTGGDATLISQHLSQPFLMEPDLVLKGLAIFSHSDL